MILIWKGDSKGKPSPEASGEARPRLSPESGFFLCRQSALMDPIGGPQGELNIVK